MSYRIEPLVMAAFGLCLAACEKEIVLDYDEAASRLVIEGEVTEGSGPHRVRISRSVNFTASNTFPEVADATVSILDDLGNGETLTHEGGGIYRTNGTIVGSSGRTYTLTVLADNETITGSSTMPGAVSLDTLEVDSLSGFGGTNKIIIPRYTDPAGIANRYRLRVFANGEKWPLIFTRDDKLSDGQVNGQPLFGNDEELSTGDTVSVDLLCIDERIHTYWFTLEQTAGDGPNGSAAPADPNSNLSGNVLGYFSAHTVSTATVIIP